QFVFSNDIKRLLELEQVNCVFQKSGNFMTSTDMSGISLTLLEIKDLSWLDYLKQETDAFAW
ncbi:MAG: dihydroxyacetone kinase subunit DhaK, partial [Vagococcus sp.]